VPIDQQTAPQNREAEKIKKVAKNRLQTKTLIDQLSKSTRNRKPEKTEKKLRKTGYNLKTRLTNQQKPQ